MNKKGFTLVELLATVVILGVLITIASFSATVMINNAKKKAGSLAVTNLKEAAITYYKQNNIKLTKCNEGFMVDGDNTSSCITSANEITVKELIEAGAFTDTKNICDKNATVTVYRYVDEDSGTDELKSYVDDYACNATDTKNQISNDTASNDSSSTNACSKYNVTKYGDGDLDGSVTMMDRVILRRYLAGISDLNCQAFKNFDLNADGKVNAIDLEYMTRIAMGIDITLPVTDYVWYGDINEDGEVDVKDLTLLRRYLEGISELSSQALKNADVNTDGSINETDKKLLTEFLAGGHSNTLPQYSIGEDD